MNKVNKNEVNGLKSDALLIKKGKQTLKLNFITLSHTTAAIYDNEHLNTTYYVYTCSADMIRYNIIEKIYYRFYFANTRTNKQLCSCSSGTAASGSRKGTNALRAGWGSDTHVQASLGFTA